MGLNRSYVVYNDALVVLAFAGGVSCHSPFSFKTWALAKANLKLTMSQAVNMMSRAKGLVAPVGAGGRWALTATGRTYLDHVIATMRDLSQPP